MIAKCVLSYNVDTTEGSDSYPGDKAPAEKGGETTLKTAGADAEVCGPSAGDKACPTCLRFERGILPTCFEGEVVYHRLNEVGRFF